MPDHKIKLETHLCSATLGRTPSFRAVNQPVERGSTVLMPRAENLYDDAIRPSYGTDGLSTQSALSAAIAHLEGAAKTLLLPSGLAALSVPIFSALKSGDEVLIVDCAYGPVHRFAETQLKKCGIIPRYYSAHLTGSEVMALCGEKTRLIYLESPGSLSFDYQNVPEITALAKSRGILTLMDNTYGGGILFRPLDHGVDMSMQALTKYVGGHSDILIGSVSMSDLALYEKLYETQKAWGFFTSADEAYLALRGLKTMTLRLQRSGASALKVARWLETQECVEMVVHPGLESHPDHTGFKRDLTGTNGLFLCVFKGGNQQKSEEFLNRLSLFGLGFSWGGYESLAIHAEPQLSLRRNPSSHLKKILSGSAIRFYIGLEDPDDLIDDIKQAMSIF